MSDGRRHSIDVPLSRTLVALRRVKSLRDPSTNSMSKYSSVLDNYTWDTDSCNGISLGIENSCRLVNHSPLGSRDFGLGSVRADFASDRERANSVSDQELDSCPRTPDSKSISARKLTRVGKRGSNSTRSEHVSDMRCYRSNGDEKVYRNESFDDRHEHDHRDKIMDLVVVPSSNINCDDLDLYGEPTLQSARLERNDLNVKRRKPGHNKRIKSSGAVTKIIGSVECSPIPSISESRMDASSRSPSIFAHDEVDIVDDNYRGCGIGCCWSRTPRYRNRESGRPSDIEDRPLLSGEGGEACVHHKSEIVPYSDSPRSLSHKFRPRSFDELVGQNLVAHSLLNALSKGKITSFYLFHGPRGTGKTSTSRIFAAALNCLSLECRRPCGLCRECMLFFSGRSRDVKEVDPAKINRTDRVRSLLKSAARPPITSRFKVYIIDECQLLLGKTWATVLNSLDNLPQHVVFVLITADLDTVPRSALSLCQRYHFPMIKDADIVNRLTKICVEEGLEIEKDALDFIADKSNGSLRDAEMILDQLSLLGRRITISSAYELIGIVSDEELLNLLDLALSSDTSNTVRRARELMRSRVDPMQLISQLANLIMDILAGKFERGTSEVGRNFFGMHSSEADLQKLRHALKILSDSEKQFRTSKNQTTWLTVALLQLSSVDSDSLDANDSRVWQRNGRDAENRRFSASSTAGSPNNSLSCMYNNHRSQNSKNHGDAKGNLEQIWKDALEKCQSSTFRSFLLNEGKLSSVFFNEGLAVAEVEFCRPDDVSRAEKSWKLIASLLQLVLGCNVEIRINLVHCNFFRKNGKVKKPSFSLLSCSRRMPSTVEDGNDESGKSDFTSSPTIIRENPEESCSSNHGSHFSPAIRNDEANIHTNGTATPHRSIQDDQTHGLRVGVKVNGESQLLASQEPEYQPGCFSKTTRSERKFRSLDASCTICLKVQPHNKLDLPEDPYFCASDPYIVCSSSNTFSSNSNGDEDWVRKELGMNSKMRCWRTPKLTLKRVLKCLASETAE